MSRKKFVLVFLACGFALHFATRILLNQAPDVLWAAPSQEVWQRHASTILSPIRVALVGPVNLLVIHCFLSRRRLDA